MKVPAGVNMRRPYRTLTNILHIAGDDAVRPRYSRDIRELVWFVWPASIGTQLSLVKVQVRESCDRR